eukprot:16450614-Heterocapsa_arctica.AAC.1
MVTMIDEKVVNLRKEQSDDKRKDFEQPVKDPESAISEMEDSIVTLIEEIEALTVDVIALEKSIAEAIENRKKENADY